MEKQIDEKISLTNIHKLQMHLPSLFCILALISSFPCIFSFNSRFLNVSPQISPFLILSAPFHLTPAIEIINFPFLRGFSFSGLLIINGLIFGLQLCISQLQALLSSLPGQLQAAGQLSFKSQGVCLLLDASF